MLLSETDQRATVLGLIERARQNSDLHADGGHPFLLKASFQASGNVQYTGSGQLEELWYSPMQWRWSARFGSYCQNRIHYRGRLNVVKNSHTFPWTERQYPGQREVFVNVRFVPPSAPKCSPDIPVWERCAAPRFVALPARSYFQETLRRAKLDHFPLTATKHAPI